jgi:hypothetical protein
MCERGARQGREQDWAGGARCWAETGGGRGGPWLREEIAFLCYFSFSFCICLFSSIFFGIQIQTQICGLHDAPLKQTNI